MPPLWEKGTMSSPATPAPCCWLIFAAYVTMSLEFFTHDGYQRHNRRRQEHLASLMLPLADKTVLELGAGVGDHTSFFIDRNCKVTATDAREDNLVHLRARFPSVTTQVIDVEADLPLDLPPHDVVYAYGILYHLADPSLALNRIASVATNMLLLETCVSFGAHEAINPIVENTNDPTQAAHGLGCRPTRPWVFRSLRRLFEHVYVPRTQPWHEEFPTNWLNTPPANATGLYRSIFVASRARLENPLLADTLLDLQVRQ
ncbi:class I SAM-dependent methyltransferase [Bradyrhizobium sp. USDA 241]|uniref:class I SAM-dependent methyltransferase n=1 Tax=Bradyrhizobium sp. USDA 241 TaxID=3377725 RepID=UPI003C7397A0